MFFWWFTIIGLIISKHKLQSATFISLVSFVGDRDLTDAEQDQELPSESEVLSSGPRKVVCPEDDEFLSALDKMVSENIQERMRETVKPSNVDISVPVVLRSNKKTYDQLQVRK